MKNAISLLIVLLIAINCNESHPNNYSTSNYPTQSKSEIYTEKLAEIHRLQKALKRKKNLSQSKISQFQEQIASARIEITQQIDLNSNNSYEKAISNQIVNNNLQVIQRADAYIEVFEETLRKIKASEIEIVRIEKFTTVDLIALEGIENNNEFDDLLRKINRMINDIQPNAEELVTPKNITPKKSLNEIWNKYFHHTTQSKTSTKYSKVQPPEPKIDLIKQRQVLSNTDISSQSIYPSYIISTGIINSPKQLKWNKNSTHIAALYEDGILVWAPFKEKNIFIPAEMKTFETGKNQKIKFSKFRLINWSTTNNDNLIVFNNHDVNFNIWDIYSGNKSNSIPIEDCRIPAIKFWDQKWIILQCQGNANKGLILKADSFQKVFNIKGEKDWEKATFFYDESNRLLFSYYHQNTIATINPWIKSDANNTIRLCRKQNEPFSNSTEWKKDQETIQPCPEQPHFEFSITKIDWMESGNYLIAKTNFGKILVWDNIRNRIIATYTNFLNNSPPIKWSSINKLIAIIDYSTVRFLSLESGKIDIKIKEPGIVNFIWHPTKEFWYFVQTCNDNKCQLKAKNLVQNKEIVFLTNSKSSTQQVSTITISNNQQHLVGTSNTGDIFVWDISILQ